MEKIMTIFTMLLLLSCAEKQGSEFMLHGATKEMENGTMLYLDNAFLREPMDSTIVQNNSFRFETALPEAPLLAVLRTKSWSHYRFLWLENNPMTFNGSASDFMAAQVTGSRSEDLNQQLSGKIDTLHGAERQKIEMEFAEKHPETIVSAYILSVYSKSWGREKTSELFEKFSIQNKASVYGRRIAEYLKLNRDANVGDQFADFVLPDEHGNLKKFSDVKAKAVLLEFWASWCGPCRSENPNLLKTYEQYKPKGFEVFAVSLDEDEHGWIKAIEEDKLPWHHASDLKGQESAPALIYGVNGIPDNFLIDHNGIIVGRNLRGDKLNEKLAEILSGD